MPHDPPSGPPLNAVAKARVERRARRAELEHMLMYSLITDYGTRSYPGQFLSYVQNMAENGRGGWRADAQELLEIWSQP